MRSFFQKGAAFAALFLLASAAFGAEADAPRRVRHVWDGDTVVLENGEKVRLIGVDTPELTDESRNGTNAKRNKLSAQTVGEFAKKSKAFTRDLVEDKPVRLEYDWQRKDKYGRTLAYIYRLEDGLDVNAEIVRQGYGFPITHFSFKRWKEFKNLGDEARAAGRGLWKKD